MIEDATINSAQIGSLRASAIEVIGNGTNVCTAGDEYTTEGECTAAGGNWVTSGLSAINAGLGDITAGTLTSPTGKLTVNLTEGLISIGDPNDGLYIDDDVIKVIVGGVARVKLGNLNG